MKYFIDTEFCENPGTIDLISIGIICEDGRRMYLLNKDCNIRKAWKNEWLVNNVFLSMYKEYVHGDMRNYVGFSKQTMKSIFKTRGVDNKTMKRLLESFIQSNDTPEFYGYYADYDWVVFCWIFGKMIDLPNHFPMYCKDLKQMMDDRGLTKEWKQENCPDPEGEHNALVDAKWNRKLYNLISEPKEKPLPEHREPHMTVLAPGLNTFPTTEKQSSNPLQSVTVSDEEIEKIAENQYPVFEDPISEIEVRMNYSQTHCRMGFIKGFVTALDLIKPKI